MTGAPRGMRSMAHPAPPANVDLEIAFLGAVLVKPDLYDAVAGLIAADDFIDPAHQRIYAAIEQLAERGQPATPGTLKLHFERDATLAAIGGARYLVELAANALNLHDAPHFARTLRDLAQRRRAIDLLQEAIADLYTADLDSTAAGIIEAAMARVDGLHEGRRGFGEIQTVMLREAVQAALVEAEEARRTGRHLSGLSTGFRDRDELTGGMGEGEMIVLAGRPGMGKTALAWNIARRVAKAGTPVAFYTQEMSAKAMARRALADEAGVPLKAIKRGHYGADEAIALVKAGARLDVPIFLVHRPGLTPAALRIDARQKQRRHGIGLVIVDHLHIMRGDQKRYPSHTAEVTDISRGLKAVAMTLGVPVLALCQLNRGVEGRDDKRPLLSDLRESGSIEQDADAVLALYRHAYYVAKEEPDARPGEDEAAFMARMADWRAELDRCSGIAEVIARKLRDGEEGTARLYWDGERQRFGDLDRQYGDSWETFSR